MTNSTSEREQRLRNIRRARELGILPWSHLGSPTQRFEVARDTVDFLLSLLDSEAASGDTDYKKLPRELALIVDVGTNDDPGTALSKLRKIQNAAATSMRDLCVDKVRRFRDASYWSDVNHAALSRLISDIDNITLEQVEQK